MIRQAGAADYTYKYLTLDVKGIVFLLIDKGQPNLASSGHSTLFLENSDKPLDMKKSGFKLFGVKWH